MENKLLQLKAEFERLREEDHDDFCRAYSRHEFVKWVYNTYPDVDFEPTQSSIPNQIDHFSIIGNAIRPSKGKSYTMQINHGLRTIGTDWIEAHHDIVAEISRIQSLDEPYGLVRKTIEENGRGGMYELGIKLTDEFIKLYEKTIWGEELEYYETIELFLNQKLSK